MNAIVTGASRGIGRAIVEKFAKQGINLWACASKTNPAFEADMESLAQRYSVWIKPLYFDLKNENEIKEAVKNLRKDKQSVDILVNNAGMSKVATLPMMSMKTIHEVFACDYFGPVFLTQCIIKMMITNGSGNIVNIGSISGLRPDKGYIAYGSAKAALMFATKVMAKELASYHIRVNAVAPGLTNTEMIQYKKDEFMEKIIGDIWLGRKAEPEEIANVVAFLCSEEAAYVTGEIVRVDGGGV